MVVQMDGVGDGDGDDDDKGGGFERQADARRLGWRPLDPCLVQVRAGDL